MNREETYLSEPVLVTGGAGFIGSHLVERLLRRGSLVRVLDDLSTGTLDNLAGPRDAGLIASGQLEITVGSACDAGVFQRAAEGCREIYHLAASVGVGLITSNPGECLRNNVEGVINLIDAAVSQPAPPRVVLFSSSEVYGKSAALPLREDADLVLGPSDVSRWSYASGKLVGEVLALAEARRGRLPVTIVRCFNTCGPRQRGTYGMVVPRLLDQALGGVPLTVYGDGRQTRCFTFVGDVVGWVVSLAGNPAAIGEVVNLGNDRETTILELAHAVLGAAGSASPIQMVPYHEVYGDRFEDVPRRVPDLGKLRRLAGPVAPVDLETLLRLTLEYRRNGAPPPFRAGAGAARPRA